MTKEKNSIRNICAVIVTYGNRFHLLKQVIDRALKEGISKVIVVDNNSASESREKLKAYAGKLGSNKIKVLYLNDNYGSAGGYKIGLQEAYNDEKCEYILLLDDDNLLENGAMDTYFYYYSKLKNKKPILVGFRDSRPHYVEALNLCSGEYLLEPKNSFIGFHIFYYLNKVFLRNFKLKFFKKNCPYVKLPTAPFGGLFFKKDILKIIGFPDDSYYLYEDDTDFTYRMTLKGFNIYMIPEIKIKDLDEYWCKKVSKIHPYFTDNEDRFYYFIRNKVYFQKKYRINNKFIWRINKFIYDIRMFILSLLNKNISRFQLYRKAKNDAIKNEMGKRKMKILFISHVLDGSGAPRSLLNLIKYMPKKDLDIEVLALRRSNLKEEFEKVLNKKISIITNNPPNNKILKVLERIWTIPKLIYFILKYNPDLVFINSAANSRAIFLSKLLRYKTYVFVHEFDEGFAFLPKIRRKFIKLADKVFCLTDIHKDWLEKQVGVKKDISVIPNGINIEGVRKLAVEEPEEEYINFTKRYSFIVSNVGYITLKKGWDLFLDIIKKLKEKKDIGFVIIGDFLDKKDKQTFLNELEKHNLQNRVYITSITNNIFKYLKYTHLTAITSRSETFSLVCLESMSLGIPVIFFDVGAIKKVVSENYPYKVEPFDIEKYVKFILEIKGIYGTNEFKALQKSLVKKAKSFDIKAISQQLYKELKLYEHNGKT